MAEVADWEDKGQYPHGPYSDYPFGEDKAAQTVRIDIVDTDFEYVFCRQNRPKTIFLD